MSTPALGNLWLVEAWGISIKLCLLLPGTQQLGTMLSEPQPVQPWHVESHIWTSSLYPV